MKFSASDLEHLTDEIKRHPEVAVMTNSVTSNMITFSSKRLVYDVQFEFVHGSTEIKPKTVIRRTGDGDKKETVYVPFKIRGDYDEVIALLLDHLGITVDRYHDMVFNNEF